MLLNALECRDNSPFVFFLLFFLFFFCFFDSGNFRTMRLENLLFNPRRDQLPPTATAWSGGIEKHEVEPYFKNKFLRDIESEEQEFMASQSFRLFFFFFFFFFLDFFFQFCSQLKDDGAPNASNNSSSNNNSARKEEDYPASLSAERVYKLGDDDVSQWSDYIGMYFHPRSLNMINDFAFGPERKFDNFSFGENHFNARENVCLFVFCVFVFLCFLRAVSYYLLFFSSSSSCGSMKLTLRATFGTLWRAVTTCRAFTPSQIPLTHLAVSLQPC
jgi:hypothetical protein